MHKKATLILFLAAFCVSLGAAEHPGVCMLRSASGNQTGGPCIVRSEAAPHPIDGMRYQLTVRGLPQSIDISVSGPSCTMAGIPCVQQPARRPGTLFFVDEEGGAVQFTAPPNPY